MRQDFCLTKVVEEDPVWCPEGDCKVTLKKQQIPILIPHQQYALTAAIFQPGDPAKKAEIFSHLREYYLQLEIQTESSGGLNQLAM